jgi:GNAT superfamily N-acetyltransferase
MAPVTIHYDGYTITTDKSRLQPETIHKWLSEESYWSKHIPFDVVKTAFDNSYCIGVLSGNEQVGYARLITDYATFAYLADVYVLNEHRGKGLSKQMLEVLMQLDWVKGLRKILLATLDAHDLYKQFSFASLVIPERYMEISRPIIYGDLETKCK